MLVLKAADIRALAPMPLLIECLESAFRIPYYFHVSPDVVRTDAVEYVQVFRLVGASFESAANEVLNNWHERLNVLWRNLSSPQVALWTQLVHLRRRTTGVR